MLADRASLRVVAVTFGALTTAGNGMPALIAASDDVTPVPFVSREGGSSCGAFSDVSLA